MKESEEKDSTKPTVGSFKKSHGIHISRKGKKILLVCMPLLILLIIGGYFAYPRITYHFASTDEKIAQELILVDKYQKENNMSEALVHAKKALAYDPGNIEYQTLVAKLLEKENPNDAKAYYAEQLNEIKKYVDDPNASGNPVSNYWTAAQLAESAGKNDDAKKYYQKVIELADPNDGYQQDLVKQSKAALERAK